MKPGTAVAAAAVALGLALLASAPAQGEGLLLSVSPGGSGAPRPPDPHLRWVDPANGSTTASVPISLSGHVVTGATGLARHPQTGVLFVLLKVQGSSFRRLATLAESSGTATDIGNTGRSFAGLAFGSDGTLYAVTGDGDGVPETLFTLSTSDASSSLVMELGGGTDGEALAFNPDDGRLYHASGIGTPNHLNGERFEKIDPVMQTVTNVPLSGFDYQELTALTFSGGAFFAGDLGGASVDNPRLFHITPGGVVTLLGSMDHVSKGLARVASDPVPSLPGPLSGLLGLSLLLIGRARLRSKPA